MKTFQVVTTLLTLIILCSLAATIDKVRNETIFVSKQTAELLNWESMLPKRITNCKWFGVSNGKTECLDKIKKDVKK